MAGLARDIADNSEVIAVSLSTFNGARSLGRRVELLGRETHGGHGARRGRAIRSIMST